MTCRKLAHVGVALAGMTLMLWGILLLIAPTASCRGVTMGPGSICYYASPTDAQTGRVQTYEERIATVRSNAPVVIGLGLAAAVFGAVLLVQQARQARRDIGP